MTGIRHLSVLLLFLLALHSNAAIPERPFPPRLVNDLAGILSPDQESNLEDLLVRFSDSTSTQIVVLIVPSLDGQDKAAYAFETGEKWGVGQKGFNNGVVLLVKPKSADSKGEVFIATGYGLEGVIPDAVARRICETEMIPFFRIEDYNEGILRGVEVLMGLAAREFPPSVYMNKESKDKIIFIACVFLILLLFAFVLTRALKSQKNYSIGHDASLWTALWLMGQAHRRHKGMYSDFSSGRGLFGGGGGGNSGFGGFGGGSFGGGGAGGSW